MKLAQVGIAAAWLLGGMLCAPALAGPCEPDPCIDDPTMIKRELEYSTLPVEVITQKELDARLFEDKRLSDSKWITIPKGTWTLSKSERKYIRDNLAWFVDAQADEQDVKLKPWSSYTFQVQGQTHNDRKLAIINVFCIPPPKSAQTQFVLVKTGDACQFRMYFDPHEEAFLELTFNGGD